MDLAILIIIIISSIIQFSVLGYLLYRVYRFQIDIPSKIGENVRISKAQGNKMQAKMNDLMEGDIMNYINDNPIVLDIFPESIAHMEVTKGQPQFINSLISMFAPAVSSVLMNSGSDRNLMANNVAGGLLSNPDAITGILSFIGNLREQAKKNYKPVAQKTVTAGSSSSGTPRAEGPG